MSDYLDRLQRELDERYGMYPAMRDEYLRNVELAARPPLAGSEPVELHSYSVSARRLEARRQERLDAMTSTTPPAWGDEQGSVEPRLVVAGVALLALVVGVALFWHYLVGAAVVFAGYRFATRGMRRRRPRSSWSSLGRTAALMYAAWNSRWLKVDRKVTVPARATTTPDVHAGNPAGMLADDEPIPYGVA